jgi:hypothetical protein
MKSLGLGLPLIITLNTAKLNAGKPIGHAMGLTFSETLVRNIYVAAVLSELLPEES